jgi:hypothetical protein
MRKPARSNIHTSPTRRQKLPLRISTRRDCALSRGRPFRSPCQASKNSAWDVPQNDASWPASNRGLDNLQEEVLPLAPAPWQITSYPRGYTRGLHRQTRACKKALFYGAFSKPFYGGGEGGIRTPDRLAPMPHFECGVLSINLAPRGSADGSLVSLARSLAGASTVHA